MQNGLVVMNYGLCCACSPVYI